MNDRAALITAITHDFRTKTIDQAQALLDDPVRKTENGDEMLSADQVVFWYRDGRLHHIEDLASRPFATFEME